MNREEFSTSINAPREKVWTTLWSDETYPQWTAVFGPGSRAVSDWKEGSKILFLGDKEEGMTSLIKSRKDNEFMSFEHLGFVKDGKEDFEAAKKMGFSGALENYTLTEKNGSTELTVSMDMVEEYASYFREKFPKAMERIKALAEG